MSLLGIGKVMTRENDIQELCKQVLNINIVDGGGDYGNDHCAFCLKDDHLGHEPNCAYLIAKDLSTGVRV